MENAKVSLEEAIKKSRASSEEIYKKYPKMKDPAWWDRGDDSREVEIPSETSVLIDKNAEKAKEL